MIKRILKYVVFILIFAILLQTTTRVLREKKFGDQSSEQVTRWIDEYKMLPKNSVNALFLGPSSNFCTVNPQQIWQEYRIPSYVLGSSAQDMNATLLYLKEAYKRQKPKVVFVEIGHGIVPNTEEVWNRTAYDNMPFSIEKYTAISRSMGKEEHLHTYLLPILRYHYRWNELTKDDFKYAFKSENNHSLNGFYPRYKCVSADMGHLYDSVENWELDNSIKENIHLIKEFCDSKGADLVLWRAPAPSWRNEYHRAFQDMANKENVLFMDLNYKDSLGIDESTDFYDLVSHVNYSGATKVTAFIGNWLANNYDISVQKNNLTLYDNWDINVCYLKKNILQNKYSTLSDYLTLLKDPQYYVLFSINDGTSAVPLELQKSLKEFGFTSTFQNNNTSSFLAIMDEGTITFEKMSKQALFYEDNTLGFPISMKSEGYFVGNDASIKLNGKEYMLAEQRGLGIVVYDKVLNEVVDSVTFDIRDNGKIHRNPII